MPGQLALEVPLTALGVGIAVAHLVHLERTAAEDGVVIATGVFDDRHHRPGEGRAQDTPFAEEDVARDLDRVRRVIALRGFSALKQRNRPPARPSRSISLKTCPAASRALHGCEPVPPCPTARFPERRPQPRARPQPPSRIRKAESNKPNACIFRRRFIPGRRRDGTSAWFLPTVRLPWLGGRVSSRLPRSADNTRSHLVIGRSGE